MWQASIRCTGVTFLNARITASLSSKRDISLRLFLTILAFLKKNKKRLSKAFILKRVTGKHVTPVDVIDTCHNRLMGKGFIHSAQTKLLALPLHQNLQTTIREQRGLFGRVCFRWGSRVNLSADHPWDVAQFLMTDNFSNRNPVFSLEISQAFLGFFGG